MVESIQIDEEQPNVEEIMRQIRADIAQRKLAWDDSGPRPASLTGRFSPPVYDHLFRAIDESDKSHVAIRVRPVKIPLIGSLLTRARALFHNLVIYYVSQISTQQIRFNVHITRALNALIHDLDAGAQPAAPVAEVAELEARITLLEAQLAQGLRSSPAAVQEKKPRS